MSKAKVYNYIIAGGGCAGLSLLWNIMHSEKLKNKQVLLIDSALHPEQEKIWSFWGREPLPFSNIISHSWNRMQVVVDGHRYSRKLRKNPYHCIRSDEYRNLVLEKAAEFKNIEILESAVIEFEFKYGLVRVDTLAGSFRGNYLFQSIKSFPKEESGKQSHIILKQHFVGWEIESIKPVFNPGTIHFMEFIPPVQNGVNFFYVLPFTEKKALIEFTAFSPSSFKQEVYEEKNIDYITEKLHLKPGEYKIIREETGVIPMETRQYEQHTGKRIFHIGTVSGAAKPGTGFAFAHIQEQTQKLTEALENDSLDSYLKPDNSRRIFRAFDILFLHIIEQSGPDAMKTFSKLFRKNSFDRILSFLAEQSNTFQNLRIMFSVPSVPFIKAYFKRRAMLFPKPENSEKPPSTD